MRRLTPCVSTAQAAQNTPSAARLPERVRRQYRGCSASLPLSLPSPTRGEGKTNPSARKLEPFALVCPAYYVTRHHSPLEGESARQGRSPPARRWGCRQADRCLAVGRHGNRSRACSPSAGIPDNHANTALICIPERAFVNSDASPGSAGIPGSSPGQALPAGFRLAGWKPALPGTDNGADAGKATSEAD